ncbi:hypothetical protein [Nocardioides sp. B-3]|uniref:hypothetical protein n=1 Tax=Nocardioides sp. B-3 TaxID=2895565 RepID=UPI002152B981|nr:hypothetical protein [Nocardioides sp. B-3]UUZ60522.1 hypothetical protein LP418_06525 [Nocardioides sp. B-3]
MTRTPMARVAVASVAILALAACGSGEGASTSSAPKPKLIKDGTLLVCTSLPYEPFEFEQDGEVVGFRHRPRQRGGGRPGPEARIRQRGLRCHLVGRAVQQRDL